MQRVKTGVKGMDELLGGGLPRGRTILLSGCCGTGKSIFASQFVHEGLKSGEPCVYLTFEQDKEKLVQDLREVGIDFEQMQKKGKLTLTGGPIGHVKYFKDKTGANIVDIVAEIKEIIQEVGAKRVVVDSVNLFTMLFENDIERRRALAALTSVLEDLDCTSILTCEVREGTNDISWYGFEDFVVDGVITLQRIRFENMYERAASVIKMRGIEHSHTVRALRIDNTGITIYPEQEPFHGLGQTKNE